STRSIRGSIPTIHREYLEKKEGPARNPRAGPSTFHVLLFLALDRRCRGTSARSGRAPSALRLLLLDCFDRKPLAALTHRRFCLCRRGRGRRGRRRARPFRLFDLVRLYALVLPFLILVLVVSRIR